MNTSIIDHIVITAPNLEAGTRWVYRALGVWPRGGGEHPRMGTHNRLLRLGESVYLEVIAPNPGARRPPRPRWFALDELDDEAGVQLKTWVVRTENILASHAACPLDPGKIEAMSRGSANWLISIPEDGNPRLDGAVPALIEWRSEGHPAKGLEDQGLALVELQIFHPLAEHIRAQLEAIQFAGKVRVSEATVPGMRALIDTPVGRRMIGT